MRLLPNAPMPPLGSVGEPWWNDRPLAIAGTGPSLKDFDFSRLNIPGVRSLAVKEAIWDMPFAEEVFCLHRPWLVEKERELGAIPQLKVFAVEPEYGPCPTIPNSLYVLRTRHAGLSDRMDQIQSGANSGFGAFNYSYLKRAKKICLFGFDYFEGHHRPEQYHWYRPGQNARYWQNWGDNFLDCQKQLADAGVEVMNASPTSTVKAFPKCSIEEGIKWLIASCG